MVVEAVIGAGFFCFSSVLVRMEITMNNRVEENERQAERLDRWKQGVECKVKV